MPIVKIHNREYQIACGSGEEAKLQELAANLDKRLNENAKFFKNANENMLLILTALTLEDLVQDLSNPEKNKAIANRESSLNDKILDEYILKIQSLIEYINSSKV
ncbi:MAG: cell division protein ZapA [Pseudomonadota bacterium]